MRLDFINQSPLKAPHEAPRRALIAQLNNERDGGDNNAITAKNTRKLRVNPVIFKVGSTCG